MEDIGWRIGAALLLVGGGAQAVRTFVDLRAMPGNHDTVTCSAVLGGIIAFFLAAALWERQGWAPWIVIGLAVLAAIMIAYVGPNLKPAGRALTWYVLAAGTVITWVLLLERPTNSIKLTIGIILTVTTQVGLFILPRFG